jgi:hypothetical protein
MRTPSILVASLALAPIAPAAQTPDWFRAVDGPASFDDQGIDVALDPATGDVVVVGNAWVSPQPGLYVPQIATVRYSPQGVERWSALYGSGYYGGNGNATHVAIAPDGNVIVAGARDLGGDWVVLAYTPAGASAWTQIWLAGSWYVSQPSGLAIDAAGDVYLCGDFGDPASFASRAALVKLDAGGAIEWVRVYDGTGSSLESVSDLALGPSGDIYLTGGRTVTNSAFQFSVARVDASGAPLWIRDHGLLSLSSNDYGRRIAVAAGGAVVACGAIGGNTLQGQGISTVAYDAGGTQLWRHDFNAPGVDEVASSLALDASGAALIGGTVYAGSGDADGLVLEVAAGQLAWSATIAGTSFLEDRVSDIAVDALGRVHVVGERIDSGGPDWFHELRGSDGTLLASHVWSGPSGGSGRVAALAVGSGDVVALAGDSPSPASGEDIVTAVYELDGVSTYCTAGTSAQSCAGSISASGTPSASAASGFTISVTGIDGQRTGLVFYGIQGRAAQPWGTTSSFLCVKTPTQRTPPQLTNGSLLSCDGSLALDWNAYRATHPGALGAPFAAGAIVDAQAWYRDPASSKSTALTDALEFTLQP